MSGEGTGLVLLSWLLQEVTGGNPYLLFSLSEMPGCSKRQRNGVGTHPTRTSTAHVVHYYGVGNLLLTVADWQEALQIMTDTASHVTSRHDNELTVPGLVYMLVDSVGPALSLHILASVGGVEGVASGEEGAELHSLVVQLAATHAQQKLVVQHHNYGYY